MVNEIFKKINKQVIKNSVKLTKGMKKNLPEEASDWMRHASFKNWIFLGVLIVLTTIIVCSKNMYVLGIMLSITGVHFIVTKNITSALMSGAIVGILYLLFIRHKTEEMYKIRENLEGAKDDTVVDDTENDNDTSAPKRTLRVKSDKDGQYVELPEEEDEDTEEDEDEDETAAATTAAATTAAATTAVPTTTTAAATTAAATTGINRQMQESFESRNVGVVGAETCYSTPATL